MKKTFLVSICFLVCFSCFSQSKREKYMWSSVTIKSDCYRINLNEFYRNNDFNNISINYKTKEIKIPRYNISFKYEDTSYTSGFKFYSNPDYGQLIIADDKSFIRFEFSSGIEKTYDFYGVKKIM